MNCVFVRVLPAPRPLGTAPSLRAELEVVLVGALWGARLGRNRHLETNKRRPERDTTNENTPRTMTNQNTTGRVTANETDQ